MNIRYIVSGLLLALTGVVPVLSAEQRMGGGALRIVRIDEPHFPLELLHRGISEGEVDVLVTVGVDGRIADALTLAYTHRELANLAQDMLRDCLFEPVRRDGVATPVRGGLTIQFESRGAVVSLTPADTLAAFVERMKPSYRILKVGTMRELDRSPQASLRVNPKVAAEWLAAAPHSRVVIDFYIDEAGRVRMPVLDRGEHGPLAEAAAAALMEWRFDPPTRKGEAVIVNAKQEFVFGP